VCAVKCRGGCAQLLTPHAPLLLHTGHVIPACGLPPQCVNRLARWGPPVSVHLDVQILIRLARWGPPVPVHFDVQTLAR